MSTLFREIRVGIHTHTFSGFIQSLFQNTPTYLTYTTSAAFILLFTLTWPFPFTIFRCKTLSLFLVKLMIYSWNSCRSLPDTISKQLGMYSRCFWIAYATEIYINTLPSWFDFIYELLAATRDFNNNVWFSFKITVPS